MGHAPLVGRALSTRIRSHLSGYDPADGEYRVRFAPYLEGGDAHVADRGAEPEDE